MSSFCSAKATHIFSAKNIRILYIESTKTVNKMNLNELVKLTTLSTTGPRYLMPHFLNLYLRTFQRKSKKFIVSLEGFQNVLYKTGIQMITEKQHKFLNCIFIYLNAILCKYVYTRQKSNKNDLNLNP